jgi:hypothetical protein
MMVIGAEDEPIDFPETTRVGFNTVVFSVFITTEVSGTSADVEVDPSLLLTQDSVIRSAERSIAATVT